jgi:hypothetical protein
MTQEEYEAKVMSEMREEIKKVAQAMQNKELNLTQLEDLMLEARQRIGERMMETALAWQVARHQTELPTSAKGVKAMHPKGKKTKHSLPD